MVPWKVSPEVKTRVLQHKILINSMMLNDWRKPLFPGLFQEFSTVKNLLCQDPTPNSLSAKNKMTSSNFYQSSSIEIEST